MRSAAQVAVPVIVPRAIVIWILVRLLVAAAPLAGGASFGSMPPPPIAVVLLCGFAGLLDVRMRGERILWGNLGVTPAALFTIYAATSVPAELLLILLAR